jgi:hypothetical protein
MDPLTTEDRLTTAAREWQLAFADWRLFDSWGEMYRGSRDDALRRMRFAWKIIEDTISENPQPQPRPRPRSSLSSNR